ncbi:response regulator [candidate division KSB1 bacterium]|nr:response regulator [candidate division KSB1 bacterium]
MNTSDKSEKQILREPVDVKNIYVLIIDDEEIARSVAKRTLEKFGFKVLTAKDGQEGVNVFRKHAKRIDGVLLDMTMPKMSGEEALGEMRRTDPKVQVILSSGYDQRNAIAKFAGKGLAGFIQKPYEPRTLVEKLNEILRN